MFITGLFADAEESIRAWRDEPACILITDFVMSNAVTYTKFSPCLQPLSDVYWDEQEVCEDADEVFTELLGKD